MFKSSLLVGVLARLILAFALATAGAMHRAPASGDAELAAFLAVGGTLDDLCGGHRFSDSGPVCEACRLVAAVLPVAPDLAPKTANLSHVLWTGRSARPTPHSPKLRANTARAPPLAVSEA